MTNLTLLMQFSIKLMNDNVNMSSDTAATVTDTDQLLTDIERVLKIYYSMFLVTIGTVLNILSIVILSRAAFRNSTTSVYLRYLACVDMFVLYNGLSRHFVSGISGFNIRYLSESFCKFNQWSSSFAPDVSAWILVAVTTERLLSIVWPHKVKTLCSKSTAAVAVTIITVIIMTSNLPMLIFYGDKQVEDEDTNSTVTLQCVLLTREYEHFMADVWYWLDLLKFVLLPSSILMLFNIIIIIFVIRSRRRVEKVVNVQTFRTKQTAISLNVLNTARDGPAAMPNTFTTSISNNNCVSGSNKEVSLTITLLVINATFVICNTPIMVYFLASQHWFPPGFLPAERLTITAAIMAMYTNNAVNFLLYCATGSRFRTEIRHMCSSFRSVGSSLVAGSRYGKDNNTSEVFQNTQLNDRLVSIMGSTESFHTYQ